MATARGCSVCVLTSSSGERCPAGLPDKCYRTYEVWLLEAAEHYEIPNNMCSILGLHGASAIDYLNTRKDWSPVGL